MVSSLLCSGGEDDDQRGGGGGIQHQSVSSTSSSPLVEKPHELVGFEYKDSDDEVEGLYTVRKKKGEEEVGERIN